MEKSGLAEIQARYIIKVVSKEEYEDPLGSKYSQKTISFFEQKFILRNSKPNFILLNQNQATTALLGRLLEFAEFKLTYNELKWRPEEIFQILKRKQKLARVYAAKIENIKLGNDVEAKILIEGSGKDIRSEIRDFLKEKTIAFSSIKVDLEIANKPRKCEIKADGITTTYGNSDPAIVEFWIKLASEVATK